MQENAARTLRGLRRHRRRRVRCAVGAALALGLTPGTAPAQPPATGEKAAVVHCHDRERGIVQVMLRHRCDGRVVSPEEAERIEAERRRERARQLQRQSRPAPSNARATRFGTAFPAGAPGRFLTARHTVDDCSRIRIATPAGERFDAAIVKLAPARDMALLRAPLERAPFAISSEPVAAGTQARALGYPNRGLPVIRPQSIPAEIRAAGESEEQGRMLAFTGPIRAGASGGPLLGPEGTVLGMVITRVNTPAVFAETGRMVRDLNFAIDAAQLRRFLGSSGSARAPQATDETPAEPPENRVLRVICRP